MIFQDFMVIDSEPGLLIGKIVKGVAFILINLIALHFLRIWNTKKHVIPRNLFIGFVFYALSPLFSLSDTVFGLKDFVREGSLFGMSLAFVSSAIANVIYFWFITAVFSNEGTALMNRNKILITIGSLQIGSTSLGLIFRLVGLNAILFSILYMVSALYIFLFLAVKSYILYKKIEETQYKNKLRLMCYSSIIMLVVLVLFSIDSFFDYPTWYSLTGWVGTIFATYVLKKSY